MAAYCAPSSMAVVVRISPKLCLSEVLWPFKYPLNQARQADSWAGREDASQYMATSAAAGHPSCVGRFALLSQD